MSFKLHLLLSILNNYLFFKSKRVITLLYSTEIKHFLLNGSSNEHLSVAEKKSFV